MRGLKLIAAAAILFGTVFCLDAAAAQPRLTTFRCDMTPPLGQPLCGNDLISTVESPLEARGVVLQAGGRRWVLCALDWCVLCNDSYREMRAAIAAAAGTTPSRVALQTVHQHTAPAVDIEPERVGWDKRSAVPPNLGCNAPSPPAPLPPTNLRSVPGEGSKTPSPPAPLPQAGEGSKEPKFDKAVFDALVQRLAAVVRDSLEHMEPFDRVGTGQARVDRVASNRRLKDAEGKALTRWSFCKDPAMWEMPEGTIDPFVKTITFARGDKPLVRLHYYATHPQTRYRDGRASSDLPGDARAALEKKEGVFQIYFTGCGGDITLGKYNRATPENRAELAARLLAGMEAAVAATRFAPVDTIRWRTYQLQLPWKDDENCGSPHPWPLSQRERGEKQPHQPIELTSLEIGGVHILHLPGEPMVCFQLYAQSLRPDGFTAVAGYGDDAPGYLCPETAFAEGGYEPSASNVKPHAETELKAAIKSLLGVE
jgi:hypothetical protein